MIHLTTIRGKPVAIRRDEIASFETVGDGAVIYRKIGLPIRVKQGADDILALWRAAR